MNKVLLFIIKLLVGTAAFIGGYVLIDVITGTKINWTQVLITAGVFTVVEAAYYIYIDKKQGKM